MYTLINPAQWPALSPKITEQAFLQLPIDTQILYEACGQEDIDTDRGFMLDEGDNNPGFGIDLTD